MRVRGVRVAAALAGLLLAVPAVAEGASVRTKSTRGASQLIVNAEPGETNLLTIEPDGRWLELGDAAAPLEAGKGCTGGGAAGSEVRCKPPKLQPAGFPELPGAGEILVFPNELQVFVRLGDGDDALDTRGLPARFRLGDGHSAVAVIATGAEGDDVIAGSRGPDDLDGGFGADTISGGSGDDTIPQGGSPDGADALDGGPGFDALEYLTRREPVSVFADDLANDGAPGEGDFVTSAEIVEGGAGDDTLVGDERRDLFVGFGGSDRLVGNGGRDFLLGGFGTRPDDDRLEGGEGDDVLFGSLGRATLLAGPGADEVDGATVFTERRRTDQRDRIDCGAGRDDARAQRKDRLTGCEKVRIYAG